MTDPLTTLSHDLHDVAAPVRDVAEIHRRASAIRRRRRGAGAASALSLAAVLGVGGVLLPAGPGDGASAVYLGVMPAQAADGTDCVLGYGSHVQLDQIDDRPDVAALLALLGPDADAPPLVSVWARQDALQCAPAAPALVVYDLDPVAGISVWPDVAVPYTQEAGLPRTDVRGTHGELLRLDGGSTVLTWVEPDGDRWLAEASGVDEDALVAFLVGVEIADDGTVTADPPAGFAAAELPAAPVDTIVPEWSASYGSGSDAVELAVHEPTVPVLALTARWSGFRPTTVHGQPALYEEHEGKGALRWDADGRSHKLVGAGGIDRLVALAEQVEPVTVDDPRLAGIPQTWELSGDDATSASEEPAPAPSTGVPTVDPEPAPAQD